MKLLRYLFLFIGFLLPASSVFNSSELFYFSGSFIEWFPLHISIVKWSLKLLLFVFGVYFLWFFISKQSWTKLSKFYYILYCIPILILCRQSLAEMAMMNPILGITAFGLSSLFAYPLSKSSVKEKFLFRLSGVFLLTSGILNYFKPEFDFSNFEVTNDLIWVLLIQTVNAWFYWFAMICILAALAKSLYYQKADTK